MADQMVAFDIESARSRIDELSDVLRNANEIPSSAQSDSDFTSRVHSELGAGPPQDQEDIHTAALAIARAEAAAAAACCRSNNPSSADGYTHWFNGGPKKGQGGEGSTSGLSKDMSREISRIPVTPLPINIVNDSIFPGAKFNNTIAKK